MKLPFKVKVLPAVLSGLMAAAVVWADDLPDTDAAADTEVVEVASSVPSERISGYFSDFLGGDVESQARVDGLRDGSIHYLEPVEEGSDATADAEAPETAETEDTGAQGMGYGNVFITLALAEQLAMASAEEAAEGETGLTADESVNEILRMREAEGMGWGQIAKELGLNLGQVISGIRSNRPDDVAMHKMDKVAGREKAEMMKAERMQARMERPERPAKPERPEKPERPAKPERPERPSR